MAASFFFYDLETSGFNPRDARVMQFAGQRTDMDLNPIGEPENHLIRMTDDVVPDPDAVFITGITPQQTISDGISEAEFLRHFFEEIATPDTIFVGFNSVRFDDEFMRYMLYRNFYDPYEWQYSDGRSRWDILDAVRMMRALRPEGINWPVDEKTGKPTNKLELLAKLNGIEHVAAHDALSDVQALITLTQLLRGKQPKLFDFLFNLRDKRKAAAVAGSGQPFLYTSGKYPHEYEKTTAVAAVVDHPKRQGAIVFDLRHDPRVFADKNASELAEAMQYSRDESVVRLPVKTLQFNRCPAIAPMSVLDKDSQKRLKLDPKVITENFEHLQQLRDFPERILEAINILDAKQELKYLEQEPDVDAQLYDGFFDSTDKTKMSALRAADAEELKTFSVQFKDSRLQLLLPLYKARNYPRTLSDEERSAWEQFRTRRLLGGKEKSRMSRFFTRLSELAAKDDLSANQQYLLEELQLYGQSIVPAEAD